MTWDYGLFLWLNFDGGTTLDSLMLFVSGVLTWVPLYLLILWLIYRRYGWLGMTLALAAIAAAVGLSDIIAGVFKHSGLLKGLLPSFPVRLRPMYTPELKGMVHVLRLGGQYGTVSAHAATATAIGFVATQIIRTRWFSVVMWTQVALVCYSRIYLASHFPQDIILGVALGVVSGYLMLKGFWLALARIERRCKR